jgi:hypothetical protein
MPLLPILLVYAKENKNSKIIIYTSLVDTQAGEKHNTLDTQGKF